MKGDYTEEKFLKHPLEDCVLRTTYNPETQIFRVFVRWSGEAEYQISDQTNLFVNALIQEQFITENEYKTF